MEKTGSRGYAERDGSWCYVGQTGPCANAGGVLNRRSADTDGDGLCDGWCTSNSTASWRTGIYYEGWNVTLPPGMPNGEDVNANGTNEQGESSPVKYDTDQDGLWDGYAYNTSAAGWQLTQVVGARCNMTGNVTSHCGEEATYSLYNGSFTGKTNRTSPDTDGDGLTDMFEVHGWPIRYLNGAYAPQDKYAISSPNLKDSEGDGITDPLELLLGTNTTANDTDTDGIWDGVEDRNRDGIRQSNETSAIENDSDRDGLCDGNCGGVGEDLDKDGVKDANEPDPLLADTDGDKLRDGDEIDLMHDKDAGWGITHDYDGDGLTDLNDKDSDDDGLDDAVEDHDRNGVIDGTYESDPYDHDTDDDGLWDGAEPSPYENTDSTGAINIRDSDSNDDTAGDADEVWVVFRTNALEGAYSGVDTWVAVIAPNTNPYYPSGSGSPHAEAYDYSAEVALYVWSATSATGGGTPVRNPYGPQPNTYESIVDLQTPEGYPVFFDESGAADAIYIEVTATHWEKFEKSGDAPGDWSEEVRFDPDFLKNKQETYDGRKATSLDPDFDGVTTAAENACGMNPLSNDSDEDTILDGVEYHACGDFDQDFAPDANDTDADGDGILDNLEDTNKNGRLDAGETDRLGTDTDADGIEDGTEDADHDGAKDAGETSPVDRDTDDDGIGDFAEIHGTWCYVGVVGPCSNDALSATSLDTDGDGIRDGVEIGLASPGLGTLTTAFFGDADPSTHTNPKSLDSDGDGLYDGIEDLNHNGRTDSGEANPTLWDTDRDGLPDGRVDFDPGASTTWKGEDLNNNGVRDTAGSGDWNETDFLANDSDVDGVFDGAEVNGSYCFKGGSCANSAHTLDPLVADTDGDGLRDGQELAGWTVGVWYERTREKKENHSVTSDPWQSNSGDSDNLTDFEEFMNGSDPRAFDSDGDGIGDWWEIKLKSNITGIEGTPPQIENVQLAVGIDWDWWGFLYLPLRSHVTVSFDVTDNVGVSRLDVRFIRYTGTESVHVEWLPGDAPLSYHFSNRFDFSIAEALVAGADVNITAFDVNENGAWGEFHVKSVLEAIADAIAAFLSAIAKVIVEAASAVFSFLFSLIQSALDPLLRPLMELIGDLAGLVSEAMGFVVDNLTYRDDESLTEATLSTFLRFVIFSHPLFEYLGWAMEIVSAILLVVTILTGPLSMVLAALVSFAVGIIVQTMGSGASEGGGGPPAATTFEGIVPALFQFILSGWGAEDRGAGCAKVAVSLLKLAVGAIGLVGLDPELTATRNAIEKVKRALTREAQNTYSRAKLETISRRSAEQLNPLEKRLAKVMSRITVAGVGLLIGAIGLAIQFVSFTGLGWPALALLGGVLGIFGFALWVYANLKNPPSVEGRAGLWFAFQVGLTLASLGFSLKTIFWDVPNNPSPPGFVC